MLNITNKQDNYDIKIQNYILSFELSLNWAFFLFFSSTFAQFANSEMSASAFSSLISFSLGKLSITLSSSELDSFSEFSLSSIETTNELRYSKVEKG